MARRLLLAALILPLVAFMFVGRAAAQAITPSVLSGALLTRDELNSVLAGVNVSANFTSDSDLSPQTGDRVGVCRIYGSNSGYAAAVCLFANSDGSSPSQDLTNTILSGQALQNVATNTGLFDTIDNVALLGSTGVADNDQLATFTAVSSGVNLNALGDVFTQGSIAGYVFFASTSTPDPGTMGGILGAQVAKLTNS